MRSPLIRRLGLLMTAACSGAPAAPVPSFGSPESAAAYLVLRPRERDETRTVILNIPPDVDMAAATLGAELHGAADSVLVWRSGSLYGDPERRAGLAHAGEYLGARAKRTDRLYPGHVEDVEH
jgi:transposase